MNEILAPTTTRLPNPWAVRAAVLLLVFLSPVVKLSKMGRWDAEQWTVHVAIWLLWPLGLLWSKRINREQWSEFPWKDALKWMFWLSVVLLMVPSLMMFLSNRFTVVESVQCAWFAAMTLVFGYLKRFEWK